MHMKYKGQEDFSELAARLAAEKAEEVGGGLLLSFTNLNAVVADDDKDDIVESIATLMYNQDITIEEVATKLTAKSLLAEDKKKVRYVLLPVELSEEK